MALALCGAFPEPRQRLHAAINMPQIIDDNSSKLQSKIRQSVPRDTNMTEDKGLRVRRLLGRVLGCFFRGRSPVGQGQRPVPNLPESVHGGLQVLPQMWHQAVKPGWEQF